LHNIGQYFRVLDFFNIFGHQFLHKLNMEIPVGRWRNVLFSGVTPEEINNYGKY